MDTQHKTVDVMPRETRDDVAKTVFAAGGLLASFGVASCCALPVALSLFGISAASLLRIGYLAAQYQRELFCGAVLMLAAAAFVIWRQRRALTCNSGAASVRPSLELGSKIAVVLAIGFLALTFWIEPPI